MTDAKRPLFMPVNEKPTSIYQKIIKELKHGIMHGALRPGDKLPSERDLSKMLGVSRTSLREALKLLEVSGLITIKRGQGAFIANNDPDEYIRRFMNHIFLDDKKIAELFQIRRLLETQAVVWACEKGTDYQLLAILKLVEGTVEKKQKAAAKDVAILFEQDSKFHYLLAKAANNSVLALIMDDLLDIMSDSRVKSVSVEGRPQKSLMEHLQIAKALVKRDCLGAKKAMMMHLDGVEKDLLSN